MRRSRDNRLVSLLPKLISHMDEIVDPFGFGVFLVAELAKSHVKVVLGGDGGDELFGGYDRYVGNRSGRLLLFYSSDGSEARFSVAYPIAARLVRL